MHEEKSDLINISQKHNSYFLFIMIKITNNMIIFTSTHRARCPCCCSHGRAWRPLSSPAAGLAAGGTAGKMSRDRVRYLQLNCDHLTGDVSVTRHVSHPDILDVGVHLLLQGGEGAQVGVHQLIHHHHLQTTFKSRVFQTS